jgi:hypothetical protein
MMNFVFTSADKPSVTLPEDKARALMLQQFTADSVDIALGLASMGGKAKLTLKGVTVTITRE